MRSLSIHRELNYYILLKLFWLAAFFVLLSDAAFSQELIYPSLPADNVTGLYYIDDQQIVFINEGGSIYKSYDGGNTWKLKKHFQGYILYDLKFVDNKTGFTIVNNHQEFPDLGLVYTVDGGETWKTQNVTISDAIAFLPVNENVVLKSTSDGKIQRLDNFFNEWKTVFNVPTFRYKDPEFGTITKPFGNIYKMQELPSGDIIAMGTSRDFQIGNISHKDSLTFFLKSKDSGISWDTLWAGLKFPATDFSFADNDHGWLCYDSLLYKTSDRGRNWSKIQNLFPETHYFRRITAVDSQHVFATCSVGPMNDFGILRTTDSGNSWDFKSIKIYWGSDIVFHNIEKGFISGSDLYKTENSGNTWERVTQRIDDTIRDINFVSLDKGFAIGGMGIYKTTDRGKSWTLKFKLESVSGDNAQIRMLNDSTGWLLVSFSDKVYKTNDAGETWKEVKLSDKSVKYHGIEFYDEKLGIINTVSVQNTPGSGVFYARYHLLTTDGGNNWSQIGIDSLTKASYFSKMQFVSPGNIWAINFYGLWHSADTAKTWKKIYGGDYFTGSYSFCFYDSLYGVLTLSYNDIYITTDGGKNWNHAYKPAGSHPRDCRILDRNIWGDLRVLESGSEGKLLEYDIDRNGNITFKYMLTTFTREGFYNIEIFNSEGFPYVWVPGDRFTVLFRQFEKSFTSAVKEDNIVKEFSLSQNYPNPFNPVTTINYSIPKQSRVELKIYDILGREVTALVQKEQSAGNYKVQFDGSSLPSGVYIYTLRTGDFTDSKKLLLMK